MDKLSELRKKIDSIDEQLLELINQRAEIAVEVGETKEQESSNPVYMRHAREAQILDRLIRNNSGPISDQATQSIFREIISGCRTLESVFKIAYLGPQGTYSEIAAQKYFGRNEKIILCPQQSLSDIFDELEAKRSNYGVVPIENSYQGYIRESVDGLINMKDSVICAEIQLRINHFFLSKEQSINDIKTLYVHEQTYSQCRNWINQHNQQWQIVHTKSNGESAQLASVKSHSAAIASLQSSEKFLLHCLASNIQNKNDNTTRFLVIGNNHVSPSGNDKTTLVFALNNKPGTLNKALSIIAESEINMTQIVSRPAHSSNWEYVFLIDMNGHQQQPHVHAGIEKLRQELPMLRVLGSYPVSPVIY